MDREKATPLVSVIVPVYNAANFLVRCIESVLNQSLSNLELILIDDGSTDDSLNICHRFAANDARVLVISKPNEGVSHARNAGLDKATGEWIIFLDADDYWLSSITLETLYSEANSLGLDLIRGEYLSVDETEHPIFVKDYSCKDCFQHCSLSSGIFLKQIVNGEFFLVLCLMKRSIIVDIRFDTHQIFLEDMKFLISILSKDLKCGYLHLDFYAYRKYETSASGKTNPQKLADSFGMTYFFQHIAPRSTDVEFKDYCQYYAVMMYCWTLQTISEDAYYPMRKVLVKQLDLKELRLSLYKYYKRHKIEILLKYRLVLSVSPLIGVYIYRMFLQMLRILRK